MIARDEAPAIEAGRRAIEALKKERARIWRATRAAESAYAIKLRKVAHQIGALIHGFFGGATAETEILDRVTRAYATLTKYADVLDPWARSAASQLVAEVAARNRQSW